MGYERTVGKAYGRGCLRSVVITIVGGVGGVLMVATVLWVAGGRNASSDSIRPLLALLVPLVFLGALLLVGLVVIALRNRRLDRAFAPLGLEGRQVAAVLRGWHGEHRGRRIDAWFSKGPTLEIYLGCEPATRGAINRAGPLAQSIARTLTSREPLDPTPPEVPGCRVYADDEEWMRSWLSGGGVEAAVGRLLTETPRVSPILSLAPGAVHYRRRFLPLSELTTPNLERWLTDLELLARACDAESFGRPKLEPGKLDDWARTDRGRSLFPKFYGCLLLGLLLTFALLFGLFYRAHYWAN